MKLASILKNYCSVTEEPIGKAIQSGGFKNHIIIGAKLDNNIKPEFSKLLNIKIKRNDPSGILVFNDLSAIIISQEESRSFSHIFVIDDFDKLVNGELSEALINETK